MFVVKCSQCSRYSKAFVDAAGLQGKCPHCQRLVSIVAELGAAPTAELPEIHPVPQQMGPQHQRRSKLPDTSPPALPLAPVALMVTWMLFAIKPGGSQLEGTWDTLISCGWIGKVEVFLFVWGLAMVCWKAILWSLQRRPLGWRVFADRYTGPTRIQPADVESCLAHVNGLVRQPRRSILLNRVCLSLEHLRQTRSVQEVRGALTGQSAIDANLLDSSYTLLRFLIWVIPIMGFIGTVMGIGMAVSQFADFIPQVSEVEKAMDSLREGLGQVTTGLGTAFNTTLVALCLVAPLMLATSCLRKLEERMLADIDAFSNHNLLGKLEDGSGLGGPMR